MTYEFRLITGLLVDPERLVSYHKTPDSEFGSYAEIEYPGGFICISQEEFEELKNLVPLKEET